MMDPSLRMLRLLSLLQTHRYWAGGELADRLSVSPRTLRRDIDRLREFGYVVSGSRGNDGGYRLEAGADLPPLLLDDEEAVAITVGLRTAASNSIAGIEETSIRVLAKLEQVLPARLRRQVNALQTYTEPLRYDTGPKVDADALTVLSQACRDWERVRFRYAARDGATSERHVEPMRLVSVGRRWYLVAWDVDRVDWRTFRVDRLDKPKCTGARFAPRELPTDAATFVQQSMRNAPQPHEADVTVAAPRAEVEACFPMPGAEFEVVDDTHTRVKVGSSSLAWMAMAFATLGHEYEIHGSAELVAETKSIAKRLKAAV